MTPKVILRPACFDATRGPVSDGPAVTTLTVGRGRYGRSRDGTKKSAFEHVPSRG